jgi:hypothetical protein
VFQEFTLLGNNLAEGKDFEVNGLEKADCIFSICSHLLHKTKLLPLSNPKVPAIFKFIENFFNNTISFCISRVDQIYQSLAGNARIVF